jgi:ADP-heptose:LPS heptosyltransferase
VPVTKELEIAFRKALLRTLSVFVRRKRNLPPPPDFNKSKFLFIRQDRIGDVLVSTPVLHALKKRYPGAIVDIVLSRNNEAALANDPVVRRRWIYSKSVVQDLQMVRGMRAERYDYAIDLMDNPSATATVLLLLAGGTRNVGLAKENSYAYDIVVPLPSRKDVHIVDRLARILDNFHVATTSKSFRIRYLASKESLRDAGSFFDSMRLTGEHVLGVNISAGSDVRFWGIGKYRALMKFLRRRFRRNPILLLYKASDQSRALAIARSSKGVVLAPGGTFDMFAALIKKLSVLVTPDTSAVHLAAAFNIPSVVLYVQSNPELRIWDPYKTPCECLVTEKDDLTEIPLHDVTEAIERLEKRIGFSGRLRSKVRRRKRERHSSTQDRRNRSRQSTTRGSR